MDMGFLIITTSIAAFFSSVCAIGTFLSARDVSGTFGYFANERKNKYIKCAASCAATLLLVLSVVGMCKFDNWTAIDETVLVSETVQSFEDNSYKKELVDENNTQKTYIRLSSGEIKEVAESYYNTVYSDVATPTYKEVHVVKEAWGGILKSDVVLATLYLPAQTGNYTIAS